MHEAMTERLRRAIEAAGQQARALNQDFVGAEHLFLGLLAADGIGAEESEAVHILRQIEVSIPELRNRLTSDLPRGDEPPVVTGTLPFSPKAKRALNEALVDTQCSHELRVSTAPVLRALLDEPQSHLRQVLQACGADLDRLERLLRQPPQHPET
jgi:ATP-dependent Clp protease ATP-binding subunit ClpC